MKWIIVDVQIRKAVAADIPRLREVIDASVRGLQAGDYSPAQIEGALRSVYGMDSQLIADGTYLVAEDKSQPDPVIVACGGWSKRRTLTGATRTPDVKTPCSILRGMPPKSAPSSSTRNMPAKASAA